MIDTHMHVDTRPYEDFEAMALSGITDVLTLAHDPMRMSSSVVLEDHFERLFSEKERVEKNGPRLHVCLGIHPRALPSDPEACIRLLDSYLERQKERRVTAIGEIGLETIDGSEVETLRRQIELAEKHRLPVIVHTPRKDKENMTRKILAELSSFSIPDDSVVVDHADRATVNLILDKGYNAGLTVQPGKLTVIDAVSIVKQYDPLKLVLNTDASSSPTDVLGVPRTVWALKRENVEESIIDSVSRLNAKRIFSI